MNILQDENEQASDGKNCETGGEKVQITCIPTSWIPTKPLIALFTNYQSYLIRCMKPIIGLIKLV